MKARHYVKAMAFLAALVVVGQLIFLLISPRFTQVSYDNKIYATVGVEFEEGDLSGINSAANDFRKTMIGWLKFPNFMGDLAQVIQLPEGSGISASEQERQNMIFNLHTAEPIEVEVLFEVGDYIQAEIDEYNDLSNTKYILTNLDYEQVTLQKSYKFGAAVTFLASVIVGLGLWFIKREMK